MSQTIPELLIQKATERRTISSWFVPLLFILFAAAMAVFSTGFLEADEITHYLYARAIWHDPYHLVSIWGRLGCSAYFGLLAPAGVPAARLLAVLVTALTAHGTAILLHHFLHSLSAPRSWLHHHATAIAWLLLFAQPCFVLNSFTVMTEMLLACVWVWTLIALIKFPTAKGILLAGALLGIGGLMRPEGWVAIAAWPLFAFLYCGAGFQPARRLRTMILSTLLAGIPPLIWYFLGAAVWKQWHWVITAWPWAPASPYGRTGGLFLLSSLAALALWMWVPVIAGILRVRKSRNREAWFLLIVPVAGFFALHGILGSLGLFGSLSLPRYFLAIAPMLTVLAALGMAHLNASPRALYWLIPATLLPTLALILTGYLPMQPTTEQRRLDIVIQAVKDRHPTEEQLLLSHPYTLLRLKIDLDASPHVRVFHRDKIADAAPGTLLIVDSNVWSYEGGATAQDLEQWGYRIDQASAAQVDAVAERFEPLTFHPDPAARVRLWIKQ